MYSVKPLDDLKERVSELQQEREQAQGALKAESTRSDQEAAWARVGEIDEQIARLQTQVEEREGALPLCERIKEIFQKNWCHSALPTAVS